MNTPEKKQRKRKAKPTYIVTKTGQDGIPVDCGFFLPSETGLGSDFSGARGLLGKRPTMPQIFRGEGQANLAILKTSKTRRLITGTLVDKLPRLQPVLEPGVFAVRTVIPQA